MANTHIEIPVIDLFAGPGGLGEGFSSLKSMNEKSVFNIKLSIEKDQFAHQTLELRAFYRQFIGKSVPLEYYEYLRGIISREELFEKFKHEASLSKKEAWMATLGEEDRGLVKSRIEEALNSADNWVLIGGPPCQAYSLVGRSRMRNVNPWKYARDDRHKLYKEYLQILADHRPPVFVMENVKGLLSSSRTKTKKQNTFELILADLRNPSNAVYGNDSSLFYKLFSISRKSPENPEDIEPEDFVVRSEEYGIPQARHRIIILGIRSDIYAANPKLLDKEDKVFIEAVISDLPQLRSGLSKEEDSAEAWCNAIQEIENSEWVKSNYLELGDAIKSELLSVGASLDRGGKFISEAVSPNAHCEWYVDKRLNGVCNHETRAHIRKDLHRYFFAAVFAKVKGRSPKLSDFPNDLLPQHLNIQKEKLANTIFNDRFRVQIINKPSTTVVSHISKDGHYYIHYDPSQCRSLTVREAARLQTFPDNYFFEGNRTQQYHQVGNAVPPLLANKIAEIVYNVLQNAI